MYETRVVRLAPKPVEDWTRPEGTVLYRGEDEDIARFAKRSFDRKSDPNEGAYVERLHDGAQLRDDVEEWQLPGR